LLLVYVTSCLVQRHFALSVVSRFSQASKTGELERHWQWVDCVQQDMSTSLEGIMASGDMDLFEKVIHEQASLPGLEEASLFDFKGRVAYSTVPSRLHGELPTELKPQLLKQSDLVRRETDGSFEIYQPMVAQKTCVECHTERHQGDILGVLSLRFSGQALMKAEQSWDKFGTDFSRANALNTIITTAVLVLVLAVLVGLCVRYFMSTPLERAADGLASEAHNVRLAAGQVTNTSQVLAEGASEQAASLEETSSSLEEMSSMIRRNTENAQKANEIARQAHEAADKGVGDMQFMTRAIEGIKNSGDDIAKIIKTIEEIAFQTNILALNAAVEAARAGEAGLGFAVVADEVRNLAHRSAQAASEISGKIENAITKTGQGVEISSKVAQALNDIVIKVKQVDELVTEVASASREQTQGITQINTAVGQMDQVTQNNAASAEESAAAAEELNAQAEVMKQSVVELFELVRGKSGSAPGAHNGELNGVPKTATKTKPGRITRQNREALTSHDFRQRLTSPPAPDRTSQEHYSSR